MKIIVLHGDDYLKSYDRLQVFVKEARIRGWNIKKITDNSQNIQDAIVQDSLFEKEKLVVINNYNLINKSTLNWLKKKPESLNVTLVIYHNNSLSKTFLKSLPKIDKEEEYKLPKIIWAFLDSFYPGNIKVTLSLLHDLTKKQPIEFIFMLLVKHLRDIYWVMQDPISIPYPSWRVGKLKRQSQRYSEENLRKLIFDLANSDIKSKTSKANLIDELDFIISTQLE